MFKIGTFLFYISIFTCVTNHTLDDNVHEESVIVCAVDLLEHVLPHQARGEVHDEPEDVYRSCLGLLDIGLERHLESR